jgi:hypothetical protein
VVRKKKKGESKMETPWGTADEILRITRGVSWVSTPSHGGLMVANTVAQKYLTPKAIEYGEKFGRHIAYEEDCACAIPFFQNPQWLYNRHQLNFIAWQRLECSDAYMLKAKNSAIPKLQAELAKTDEQIREEMREQIMKWYPKFFE